ncbi:isoprenyl transferase [Corynebacterium choanae]|uniref:Isoprenyl transferase n=1 Tax=Corynebacterium choanae TaxID=1862358 RepID=A0A3G6J4Z3_9CORY|nr:isoprenyl transferase [Corynebacterium choanae]AZA13161.1 (2Z,6E)-farnesyl diphosphate synthase [Corynebacterium choanae]
MDLLPKLAYPAYENALRRQLRGRKIPKHVAVMCDGNRRWAKEAGFTDTSHGHRVGAKKIAEMVGWCEEAGVELVTVYLLSTENLQRSEHELQLLLDIICDVVDELADGELQCTVRLVGHLDLLPPGIARRLADAAASTENHAGLVVNVAVGYGGRQEIVDAVKDLVAAEIAAGTSGEALVDAITVEAIASHLYTSGQPDPDLVIRTSGEQRLSGFLLWQAAYSEIWFTDTYWPAFRRIDFLRALRSYASRSRRFGK